MLLDVHSFRGEGEPFVFFGPEDNTGPLEPFRHGAAELALAACLGVPVAIHGWLDNYVQIIAARERLNLRRSQSPRASARPSSCALPTAMA